MKLEINQKKKTGKHTNTRRLNNMLLSNEQINNEIMEQIKNNTLHQKKIRTQCPKIYRTKQKHS